jgi:hypothetical protein
LVVAIQAVASTVKSMAVGRILRNMIYLPPVVTGGSGSEMKLSLRG